MEVCQESRSCGQLGRCSHENTERYGNVVEVNNVLTIETFNWYKKKKKLENMIMKTCLWKVCGHREVVMDRNRVESAKL